MDLVLWAKHRDEVSRAVYLQSFRWYILPCTRTPTTAHYECVLVNRESGERGIVQVKSGYTGIDAAHYSGEEKAFLFAASGSYGLVLPSNIVVVTRDDLTGFMHRMPHLLARAVIAWIAIVGLPATAIAEAANYGKPIRARSGSETAAGK